ncbi:bifunctional oligoribonuclease/PAP phosphatase NrnA [Winogradskyella echinorum]|uniref:Bifunctional oligoribonuclease/PAP phosphatase NrnA n=1 Tax=Winogradskyella echinorum TaxID=538189 RepID=A0ABR6Y4N3_9FLAO|nr:bifunctional oligoribonuclease/PAP phosphatase NrnA [Winogradskyella echinorum]MBC3847218.1 bifunctional oligoribonuclease/PAP phosphatase NrnA [Winogradskyella echinorum]MBC5751566.1 bifunctional oligoribonuclease/PAP phosphatase NrnA [Winogradskyella echinorum]
MIKAQIPEIKALLSTPKNIIIVPHKNPDGDAMGSTLGLYHYLNMYNHNVVVITPNDYPDFLKWLPGDDTVLKFETQQKESKALIDKADLLFTLDFNAFHRAGDMEETLEVSKAIKLMIDHHQQPDDYAKYTYSDVSMSSTCEMVFNFIEMLGDTDKIDATIATCLYVGIMTDTGSFRFPATTSRTHFVIGNLIEKGANNSEIHNNIFDTNSFSRLQLLGRALQNLKVIPELRTAYITLSQVELDEFNFKKGDTEGFVNYALSLKDIIFAAIFIESQQDGIIKISLRSKGAFSVNEFSRAHFNGGGHTNAAGGRSETDMQTTIDKFISILPTYKQELSQ